MKDSVGTSPFSSTDSGSNGTEFVGDVVKDGATYGKINGKISDSDTRAIVALILVGIFACTNLGLVILVFWDQAHNYDLEPVRLLGELLLPTQGALIGSAIGFYFADSRR